MPLAEAREAAARMRRLARDGGDPLAERRRARMVVPTFKEAAEKVHAETAHSWKNHKHAAQWLTTLKTYAFPSFGSRPAEETVFPNFVTEKALAHTIDNKVEAAYRRGNLLKKRRELMQAWADYCGGTSPLRRQKPTRRGARHQGGTYDGNVPLVARQG